jgi:hypothetical protein
VPLFNYSHTSVVPWNRLVRPPITTLLNKKYFNFLFFFIFLAITTKATFYKVAPNPLTIKHLSLKYLSLKYLSLKYLSLKYLSLKYLSLKYLSLKYLR